MVGSAREHAALQPRYLNCSMVLAKSFARIHEMNLKKQGILPLTFARPDDYYRVPARNVRLSTIGLVELVKNGEGDVKVRVEKDDGDVFVVDVNHTMSRDQLQWFRYGSALNMIRDAGQ